MRDVMMWARCAVVALLSCPACVGQDGQDGQAPAWWSLQVTPENPMGGEWQDSRGRCLFTGVDRLEWDGDEIECDWLPSGETFTCVTSYANGFTGPQLTPVDLVAGYLGDARFWDESRREHYLEPGCR